MYNKVQRTETRYLPIGYYISKYLKYGFWLESHIVVIPIQRFTLCICTIIINYERIYDIRRSHSATNILYDTAIN